MENKHTSLATKYRPQDWNDVCGQESVVNILRNQVETGTFKQSYLLTGKWGSGKAIQMDADILGPEGYFKMRDAKVGMKVWGEDGKLHTIVGVYPQGMKEMYRIYFSDNTFAECCIDHLWTMRQQSCSITAGPHQWFTQSVRWLLKQDLWTPYRTDSKGHKENHRKFKIPVTKPLDMAEADLPIDPYLLGQLLSDGSISDKVNTLGITISDEDVRVKVNNILNEMGIELAQASNPDFEDRFDYYLRNYNSSKGISTLKKHLEDLDLRKKSVDKHIPHLYLFSSIEQRLQLLQGLFDGDGSIQHSQYTYSTSSKQLYEDIKFLIQSLGGIVYVNEGKDSFRTLADGSRKYHGTSYEFVFHLPKGVIPFTSDKHKKRYGKGSNYDKPVLYRFIDRIEKIEDAECQCIMTDNPTGLFLIKDCIVTHNTTCARILAKSINGTDHDIYEIDAATHNGVDHVRAIAEDEKRKPLVGKYKVYILDECHLTSQAAWGAWLKLLEEPPATAINIFATTNPEKVPNTILSRVQRYDFTNIPRDQIYKRLKYISEKEKINIDEASLQYLSKAAEGGMRDAISMLDKCASLGKDITMREVTERLSLADYSINFDLMEALVNKDPKSAVSILNGVYERGLDIRKFMQSFMWFVCDVCNYFVFNNFQYISIPDLPEYVSRMKNFSQAESLLLLDWCKLLNGKIRMDNNPKNLIIVEALLWTSRN